MANPQTVGQWRINIENFTGHTLATFRRCVLNLANGKGAFSQLDQGDTYIVDHRDQHLAHVVELLLVLPEAGALVRINNLADSRHAQNAINQVGDINAKLFFNNRLGSLAFTNASIEHGRDKRLLIQTQVGQNIGHGKAG